MKILCSKHTVGEHATCVFKPSPVAAGCAVFLSVLGANVQAQDAVQALDANGNPISQVTVTGIRRGIEAAISIKKNSNSIVEAISAEDIGKLPDATVAESVSRLPGVTTQRDARTGRAASISVRGMSPDFNGTLLNGREQASASDSRGVRFDLYPAEMLGTITVYKSPDATLMGQGIASTIDQRTVLPLDFAGRTVAASYRAQRTGAHNEDLGSASGYRTSLAYIDQFANRTVGVALGVVKFSDNGPEQINDDGWGGTTGTATYNGQTVTVPNGLRTDVIHNPNTNKGLMGILQYRPSKDFLTTIDLFHSKNTDSPKRTGFEGSTCGSTGGYDPVGVLSNANIVDGVAVSGTCSNFKGDIRNNTEVAVDTLNSWGINGRLRRGDWTFTGDVSGSRVRHDFTRYETTAGLVGNTPNADLDSISWTGFDGRSNLSALYKTALSYTDRSRMLLTDVDGWGGGLTGTQQSGYVAIGATTDEIKAARFGVRHDVELGPLTGIEFGLNRTNRIKSRDTDEGSLLIGTGPYGAAPMPGNETVVTRQSGIPVASWNPLGSLGSVYHQLAKVDQVIQTDKNWHISEKVSTAYVMGSLEGELFGLPYRGNAGAQYIHTSQGSTGLIVDNGRCAGVAGQACPAYTIAGHHSYNDFLPSLNLNVELPADQVLRLGIGKTLSRPNMSDMRPGGGVGLDATNPAGPILAGGSGNPKLEPFRAKSFDLSYEKYFEANGAKGYVAMAGFYKKLDTYILRAPQRVDYASTGFLVSGIPLPATGPNAGSTVGILTTPSNGSGGNIKGLELTASLPFAMLTRYLGGFGVEASYSSTLSSVTLPRSGITVISNGSVNAIPLPGLSHTVTNMRVYYERAGFRASVAARKRGDFVGDIHDYKDDASLTYIKGNTTVDGQLTYDFGDTTMLKGLSLTAAVNNWTNSPYIRYNGDPTSVVENVRFGRTYSLGASYKF